MADIALTSPAHIFLKLDAQSADEVMRTLTEALLAQPDEDFLNDPLTVEEALHAIKAREQERPALLGAHLACPHARLPQVKQLRVAVATLARPIHWEDGAPPVQWVVLMLASSQNPAAVLKLLAQLAHLAQSKELSHRLLDSENLQLSFDWLRSRLRPDDSPLTAAELMRFSYGRIGPETPVTEITRQMVIHNLDCAGITDSERRMIGQVSADDLFTMGMPDFFRQLESVSFIAEYDPFEKYFSREAALLAKDVMTLNFATCPPEATILEVVHLLSVKGFPKVFVVDPENRLLGVIDRIRVIDRLLDL